MSNKSILWLYLKIFIVASLIVFGYYKFFGAYHDHNKAIKHLEKNNIEKALSCINSFYKKGKFELEIRGFVVRDKQKQKQKLNNSFHRLMSLYHNKAGLEKGGSKEAIYHFNKAIEFCKKISNKRDIAVNFYNLGATYFGLDNLKKAYEYFAMSLEYKDYIKNELLAKIYGNIGIVHLYSENYERSIKYFNTALAHTESLSSDILASIYYGAGLAYFFRDEIINSIKFIKLSQEIEPSEDKANLIGANYIWLANLEGERGLYNACKDSYRAAIGHLVDKEILAMAQNNLAILYAERLGNYELAEFYLKEAINCAPSNTEYRQNLEIVMRNKYYQNLEYERQIARERNQQNWRIAQTIGEFLIKETVKWFIFRKFKLGITAFKYTIDLIKK